MSEISPVPSGHPIHNMKLNITSFTESKVLYEMFDKKKSSDVALSPFPIGKDVSIKYYM